MEDTVTSPHKIRFYITYLGLICHTSRFETCFSLCGNLRTGLVPFDCPDVDSVEDPRPQAGQSVGGAAGLHWDLPTGTLRGAVGYDVTVYLGLGRIP